MIAVRQAERGDADAWLELRSALWPEGSLEEHAGEIDSYFAGRAQAPFEVLLAFDGERAVGLAELSIRWCAEGCTTDHVAYLEGWYVAPEARRAGVGRALVRAAEEWARAQACTEFASDTDPANERSREAHRVAGFDEVGLVRCFRKVL
jgi:aminoglycoside 6'-N-acetyltransferase I